jgi:hypothetical protein
LKITETPVFAQSLARKEQVKLPFVDALRHQWREVLLAGGTLTMVFGYFYIGSVYLVSYGQSAQPAGLGIPRPVVLGGIIVGGLVFGAVCVGSALLSDRLGRRTVVLAGNAAALVVGPATWCRSTWARCSCSGSSASRTVRRRRTCRRSSRPATGTPVRVWATTWPASSVARCR